MRQASLNQRKFESVVLYLLQEPPVPPGLTSLLKMLFFADCEHYRAYLSTITGAQYVALPNGPVIDGYKDLFAELEDRGILERRQVELSGLPLPKTEYVPRYEPDREVLTTTELQVLSRVVFEHGTDTGIALSHKTHLDGPWPLVWDPSDPGRPIPHILFRWLDNMPDEQDIAMAEEHLLRPDVLNTVRALDQ